MKRCNKCGEEKDLSGFHKDKTKKYGVTGICKTCRVEYRKEHYERNKERVLEQLKEYRENKNNKEKRRKYERERRNDDSVYRMITNYRNRLVKAYVRGARSKGTMELLGCTGPELAQHLEKQFQPGMTHENYGEWHIDHIKPIASFDLSDPEQEQECFHYTNLQPLWATDNMRKKDKST